MYYSIYMALSLNYMVFCILNSINKIKKCFYQFLTYFHEENLTRDFFYLMERHTQLSFIFHFDKKYMEITRNNILVNHHISYSNG